MTIEHQTIIPLILRDYSLIASLLVMLFGVGFWDGGQLVCTMKFKVIPMVV